MIYERLGMEFLYQSNNASSFIYPNVVVLNDIELHCQSPATPAALSDE